MMFGLTFEKLILIGIIAAFLIGPQRLPEMASKFATLIKRVKAFTDTAQDRVKAELGDDADAVDWKSLDPRQYDPRRIIREALTEQSPGKGTSTVAPPIVAEPVETVPIKKAPAKKASVKKASVAAKDAAPGR